MADLKNIKASAATNGDAAIDKTATKALRQLHADAFADGRVLVGPVKLTKTKDGVTASAKGADTPVDDADARPVRARADVEGDVVKAANGALKALREKALEEHKRLVGPLKVSHTTTRDGREYVTASGKAVPLDGLLGEASITLAAVSSLGDDATATDVRRTLKRLEKAVKDAAKVV